jgi:uncharacterized membrane protein YgdD (TMEM256/DUF423 family)
LLVDKSEGKEMWLRIAGILMFLGVGLGAFGSHALKAKMDAYSFDIYRTAVLYHLIHAMGLFVVAHLSTLINDSKIQWAGILLVVGIVLFSGSLYLLAITGQKWLGAVTPIGGAAFLMAWLLIAFSGLYL